MVAKPMTTAFVSTHGESTMRRNQTDANCRHHDGHPWTHLDAQPGVTVPAQPPHAMANVRTTFGLIAGLLLTWVIIVV
jgi:hypothetical protein